MLTDNQMPDRFKAIVDEQVQAFSQKRSIQVVSAIPDTSTVPLDNQTHWYKVPEVICVFVDMKGSTRLSANTHDLDTAGAYQLFTGTAVRLFNSFESPYIDVRGDGVFALFNSNQVYRALAAAVTFQTFSEDVFAEKMQKLVGFKIGAHIGIDQKTVLVKRIGLRRVGRDDRQNEVWAGKPVNMAAKLASLGDNQIIVSDRYYAKITNDLVRNSCGCNQGNFTGERKPLWNEKDVSTDDRFDFEKAFFTGTHWCKTHGKEYCTKALTLDT